MDLLGVYKSIGVVIVAGVAVSNHIFYAVDDCRLKSRVE